MTQSQQQQQQELQQRERERHRHRHQHQHQHQHQSDSTHQEQFQLDDNITKTESTTKKRSNPMATISEEELQSRLAMIRKYVAKPIPRHTATAAPAANNNNQSSNVPWTDPQPALIENVLIGNKYHAADIPNLLRLGVTAVLNCASGGISRLPVEELKESGIRYAFTNVRQDNYDYPILHDRKTFEPSQHLQVAKSLYQDIQKENDSNNGSKVLFFCVAGQNRSATLAIAVLLLYGHSLETIVQKCSQVRPFILENTGFQQQLVELEFMLKGCKKQKVVRYNNILSTTATTTTTTTIENSSTTMTDEVYDYASPPVPKGTFQRTESYERREAQLVEIELLIPGLFTMDVKIPIESTISTVKKCLVDHANQHLLKAEKAKVAKSWVVLASFGYDSMYDFPLEEEAIDLSVQMERMKTMFNLKIIERNNEQMVQWNGKCRFALVIFSVLRQSVTQQDSNNNSTRSPLPPSLNTTTKEVPWTWVHKERMGAPATLLENTLMSTHLRAWDFVTGQAYCSNQPIVFSYSSDPRDKRSFMKISSSANEPQQFHAPGEGGILGMGRNAIVHRVELKPTSSAPPHGLRRRNSLMIIHKPGGRKTKMERVSSRSSNISNSSGSSNGDLSSEMGWDAAVKRQFSLTKMLASMENSSEAGLAKRLRFANSLNSDGRVLHFYGLGVALAANANNFQEYKFEATLLARYEEEFSTYTMKRFISDYVTQLDQPLSANDDDEARRDEIQHLQDNFSFISVKVLLVSLLNGFRDLTLMGVQAFDFNHLDNVLVSRDHRNVRLIDIDGDSKGSIQFPSEYIQGSPAQQSNSSSSSSSPSKVIHKPCLDIELNTILPTLVQQLLLGKGRGKVFVTNTVSEIWRAKDPQDAKATIKTVIRENFFSNIGATTAGGNTGRGGEEECLRMEKHLGKVAEWFYAMLKKQSPWRTWTNDIYDAMRCIDHLPVT